MEAEVVVRVQDENVRHTPQASTLTLPVNGTPPYPLEDIPDQVIVRAEEVLIVVLVLMIWVAAIALFFNRWGKIRMLEPYQPKFQQQHRASCPMGDSVISPQVSVKSERLVQRMKHQRMSFSKYNVNCLGDNPMYASLPSPNPLRRPRQNSVFVGSSTMAFLNPPRRAKSAMDIQHMILSDNSPGSLSGYSSLLPMMGTAKRPSITIEKPQCSKFRPPNLMDQSCSLQHHRPSKSYLRRPSCFVDRPHLGKHRHFISFDQPNTSWERRTSITIERPSSKVLSFEQPCGSSDQPSLIIEPPSTSQDHPPVSIMDGAHYISGSCPNTLSQPSTSRRRPSFHLEAPSPNSRHRLSVSLDCPTYQCSDVKNMKSPVSTSLDETKIHLSESVSNV